MFNVTELLNSKEGKGIFLQLEGNANDLYRFDEKGVYKSTTLVEDEGTGDEVLTITIDSLNEKGKFPIFDKLLDKKIRMTVEII